ncbi:hypothetical protein [Ferrovibrio sp.]|uniref:hypothetical protein n=1 Tax=Ferrovibrio sp. TaxID=1917215 RepID=UPI00311E2F46
MPDFGSLAYLLVLAANFALIALVGGLAYEKGRDAWQVAAARARQAADGNRYMQDNIESAEKRAAQLVEEIAAAKETLARAQANLEAMRRRHAGEPLPFAFRATPTENFDPGGSVWEFHVRHDFEGTGTEDGHPAELWQKGRLYLVQSTTQQSAQAQLERRLRPSDGFQIRLVRRLEHEPVRAVERVS